MRGLLQEDEKNNFTLQYINEIIEVAMRARLTLTENSDEAKAAKNIASEVLELLEQKIGSSAFIGSYGQIQQKIQSKRAERKRALAADAVLNPKEHAIKKVIL